MKSTPPILRRIRLSAMVISVVLAASSVLAGTSTASAAEASYSVSSPSLNFATYGCQNANFTFGVTGIDTDSHWSLDWEDGLHIFEYDFGYGPTSKILTTSICANEYTPGTHTIPAVLELSGIDDPAIGSGYTTKSIPLTLQFSTSGPVALPITASLFNDSGTVQVPSTGGCRTVAFSLTVSGILSTSSWSGTFRSGALSTSNYGSGSGTFRVPIDICKGSLPAGINVISAEIEFTGVDDPSLGSGYAHSSLATSTGLLVSVPSKVSIKASTKKLSGVFKPANLGSGSKVVVYFKKKGKSTYKKWKTTTVNASGTWQLKRKLAPGTYYALAVGTPSVDGAKSRSVKVK